MYEIKPTSKFQRDLKRAAQRGYDLSLLRAVIKQLAAGEELPSKYRDPQRLILKGTPL